MLESDEIARDWLRYYTIQTRVTIIFYGERITAPGLNRKLGAGSGVRLHDDKTTRLWDSENRDL